MTPRRILMVGNFHRKTLGREFFNTEHKLLNGFIRAGHCTLAFSDRDVARESSLLRSSRTGARGMNARLLETAAHFQPHLVLFFHSDLVVAETFEALRQRIPGVRLAQVNVDSIERVRTMAAFSARAAHLDVSFITTGDPEALEALEPARRSVRFMPNPVDESVETARVWEAPRDALSWDLLFLGNGDARRPEQIAALRAALPQETRFRAAGGFEGSERLSSVAFLDVIASGAQGPCLQLDETRPNPLLYASNRIAILLGQGVLTHVPVTADFERLYEDGIVPYSDMSDLAQSCAKFCADDVARRSVAERGWKIARARTSSERVARFLLIVALERPDCNFFDWENSGLL